jgi:hypothetical protein
MVNPPTPAPAPAAPPIPTIADMIKERDACVATIDAQLLDYGTKKAAGQPGDWDGAMANLRTQRTTLIQAAAQRVFQTDEIKEAVAALKKAGQDLSDEAKKLPDATTYLKNVATFTGKVTAVASLVKNGVTQLKGGG